MMLLLAPGPAILIAQLRSGSPLPGTVALVAAWCAVAFPLGWLAAARMSVDAATIGKIERAGLRERRGADAAFESLAPLECSEDEFAAMADAELDALPPWIQARIRAANVAIDIQDEREGAPRTLGLFRRSTFDGMQTAEITLYRLSILRAAGSRDRLRGQIHDTILHELGHLFGMSESDLDEFSIGNHPRPGATPVHPPAPAPRG